MPSRRSFLKPQSKTATPALVSPPVFVSEPRTYAPGGLLLGGYDPVAYFVDDEATIGHSEITSHYRGTTVRFASDINKALFDANPAKYMPAYGGHCAYAAAEGYAASSDPEIWSIHEGRLFLNYSAPVRSIWALRKRSYIEAADRNWPGALRS